MEYTNMVANFITVNLPYVLAVLAILILCSLIVFININIKLNRLVRRYRRLMQGAEGRNLEGLLLAHIDEVRQATKECEALRRQCQELAAQSRRAVQKVGVVRFNAFADIGSDLSYAVALLDGDNNGVVLSSIFSRDDARTYAKPIENGESRYFLTAEEQQALAQAQGKKLQ